MNWNLEGKIALITGASSGIGRSTALAMARDKVKVAALSHSEDELGQTIAEIERGGGEALPIVADISQPPQMENATSNRSKSRSTIQKGRCR